MNQTTQSLIFAHRGANKEAAENTRSAFDQALTYPIDGMETDIQLSRDGVPVLWHDRFLAKLGYPARHIDDFDYSQLQAMNFAGQFSSGAKPEGIMSLQEFLYAYRKRTRLLLEIKNREWELRARHENKVQQTLAMVGQVNDDRIIISSFNLDSLIYAQQCRPGFPLVCNFEDEQTLEDARRVLTAYPFLHGLNYWGQLRISFCMHNGDRERLFRVGSHSSIFKKADTRSKRYQITCHRPLRPKNRLSKLHPRMSPMPIAAGCAQKLVRDNIVLFVTLWPRNI